MIGMLRGTKKLGAEVLDGLQNRPCAMRRLGVAFGCLNVASNAASTVESRTPYLGVALVDTLGSSPQRNQSNHGLRTHAKITLHFATNDSVAPSREFAIVDNR